MRVHSSPRSTAKASSPRSAIPTFGFPRTHTTRPRMSTRCSPPSANTESCSPSAPSSNTRLLLACDHAAPEPTLALTKAIQPCCGRVRPLAWCSQPRSGAALLEGALVPRTRNGKSALERLQERIRTADRGWFFAAIAQDVAERRQELGLSQRELAELVGTTQSAIARLERGGRPPRIDTLLRIADALDCDLAVELRPRS